MFLDASFLLYTPYLLLLVVFEITHMITAKKEGRIYYDIFNYKGQTHYFICGITIINH